MLEKPAECNGCPVRDHSRGFIRSEGLAKFGVMFAGETNNSHETSEGLPLRPNSESGSLLTQIVQSKLTIQEDGKFRKMDRKDFLWDSVIKCDVPGDYFHGEAAKFCNIHNDRSFNLPTTKVIVALGLDAFRTLTGIEGKKRGIDDVRGYVFKSSNKLIIPTYSPRFIRRGHPNYTNALIHDVKKALVVAQGNYNSYDSHSSFTFPTFCKTGKLESLVSLYYKLRDNPNLTLFYDIENPYSRGQDEDEKGEEELAEDEELKDISTRDTTRDGCLPITSIQFAIGKDWAITVPWEKPFLKVAAKILSLPNEKVAFNNWVHDDPRLRSNNIVIDGVIHDAMWAWHHMQSGLRKALQMVASFFDFPYIWKHLAFDEDKEDEYGGSDVISLAYIWEKLPTRMRQVGVWDSYLKYKVRYHSRVLEPTQVRGVFVDEVSRQQLVGEITSELKEQDNFLQASIPRELLNIEPKVKDKKTGEYRYGFMREPAIVGSLRAAYGTTRTRLEARGIPSSNIMPFEKWASSKTNLELRQFQGITEGDDLKGDDISRDSSIARWCRVKPFKASKEQIVKYMKHMGYKVPTALKTGKETTGKKDLQEVYEKTEDEIFAAIIKVRSLGKMLTNDLPNWAPASDGRVHTTFKFDPPNWQLNASNPNIQNARKHEPDPISKILRLGSRFRSIVKAPPGRFVAELDKKSFHVTMMGFEARDPLYIKWSKVDMHTLITSYIVKEPIPLSGEPDMDKIKYIKKKFKSIRDTQGKPTVLGNQLGLGPGKLFWMNKTYIDDEGKRQQGIESKKKAEWLQSLIADLFPKVDRYKTRIKEEAYYKGFLISNYGGLRWFSDVLRWDYASRSMRNGSEAEEAMSHPVQTDAFGMIHSEILDMGETSEILEEHWFANTVHDSVIFFPEWSKRDRFLEEVVPYMVKPAVELRDSVCCPDGLAVDVDISLSPEGGNWASYHKEKNPMGIQEIKNGK